MPYVNVKVTGTIEPEQRKELAARISGALEDVLGKPRKSTYIIFEEVPRTQWAVGDMLVSDLDNS